MLARGLTRRCPRCGNPKIFSSYFKLLEACPRCGYGFSREEGYWVGAVIINTAVTETLFLVIFLAVIFTTQPDVSWATLLAVGIATNVLWPLFFYPFSKTLWMAIDICFLHRMDE